ncbi:alpha-1,2-fucosyltransferase, partial [bacterium]|nr:alpha-1,2-fucosyltransferase [bacterium]
QTDVSLIHPTTNWSESSFAFCEIPDSRNQVLNIDGYLQSDKYFESYEFINNLFEFDENFVKNSLKNAKKTKKNLSDKIAIHVRHGDSYDRKHGSGHILCQDKHPIMTPAYYQNSFEQSGKKKEDVIIFADHNDTIAWIQENLPFFAGCEIIFTPDFIADFYLMSQCKTIITANSTFSWWAAYLGSDKKQIFAPCFNEWFGETYRNKFDTKDIIPSSWNQVKQ